MRGPVRPQRLRVAYVTASLDLGGSERQMVNLATRLPRDLFAPEFVLLTGRGPLADVVEEASIPVHHLGWRTGDVPWRRVRRVGDVARYVALMRRRRFDLIDAWLFHAYALAAVSRNLSATPVLIAGRRSLSDFKNGFDPFKRALDDAARRRVDAIVANSDSVRDDVVRTEGLPIQRIDVIRNGIDTIPDLDQTERRRLRSGWGFADDDIVVGTVANHKPGKGVETVIDIADRLREHRPRIGFVLVGDGPLRPVLEAEIAARGLGRQVIVHGHAPDARSLYGAFDITLQASHSEGLPNAILEAAAAGRPVVATAVGGTTEIVVDGETGYLVAIEDRQAMADALTHLARDPAACRAMGLAGRRRTEALFGMDRFVAETAALYERVWMERVGRR